MGMLDLAAISERPPGSRAVLAQSRTSVDRPLRIRLHLGADWFSRWWLNGRLILDRLESGNTWPMLARSRCVEVHLQPGVHELTACIVAGSGGCALAVETHEIARGTLTSRGNDLAMEAVQTFSITDPTQFRSLTLHGRSIRRAWLNGERVSDAADDLDLMTVHGIPPNRLRSGTNELSLRWTVEEFVAALPAAPLACFEQAENAERIVVDAALVGLTEFALQLDPGIALGRTSEHALSLVCNLNMPARLTWQLGTTIVDSPPALTHHLRATDLPSGETVEYTLTGHLGAHAVALSWGSVRLPTTEGVRIAIAADAGPLPDVWRGIADRISLQRPNLCVFVGDHVSHGRVQAEWKPQFFDPAAELLRNVPLYPVPGNHDQDSPLLDQYLCWPGKRWGWAQLLGPVLLIGIEGAADWSDGSPARRWLIDTLETSKARYILGFNHYPAFSSGPHLRGDDMGLPRERACRVARSVLLPIWEAFDVTAVFSGHDHFYERSQLPGGLTLITTGGAGAYLYDGNAIAGQNPHSRCLVRQHHFCLLDVSADTCELRVIGHDGSRLDDVRFVPRRRNRCD
ncbi:metallophosphoesterase [Oscillatoria amoena NRMC-F 0135]|nr:metallophosphoesterase [Oscillatoria amoena NRMC-F 0135]